MSCAYGITISRSSLVLSNDHRALLTQQNIAVSELPDRYILHSSPSQGATGPVACYLKGLLQRIRSDEIYNSYNDDFGLYNLSNGKRVAHIMKK